MVCTCSICCGSCCCFRPFWISSFTIREKYLCYYLCLVCFGDVIAISHVAYVTQTGNLFHIVALIALTCLFSFTFGGLVAFVAFAFYQRMVENTVHHRALKDLVEKAFIIRPRKEPRVVSLKSQAAVAFRKTFGNLESPVYKMKMITSDFFQQREGDVDKLRPRTATEILYDLKVIIENDLKQYTKKSMKRVFTAKTYVEYNLQICGFTKHLVEQFGQLFEKMFENAKIQHSKTAETDCLLLAETWITAFIKDLEIDYVIPPSLETSETSSTAPLIPKQ